MEFGFLSEIWRLALIMTCCLGKNERKKSFKRRCQTSRGEKRQKTGTEAEGERVKNLTSVIRVPGKEFP